MGNDDIEVTLENASPKQIAHQMGLKARRKTPFWLYLDMEKDVYVAEYPELRPHKFVDGKIDENAERDRVRVEHMDENEAVRICEAMFHGILHVYRDTLKRPIPWMPVDQDAPTGEGDVVKTISVAY